MHKTENAALPVLALADQIERDGVTVHGVWHPAETVKQMIVSALRASVAGTQEPADVKPIYVKRWRTLVKVSTAYADEIRDISIW